MPFFDLIMRWVESSDFGPKSDEILATRAIGFSNQILSRRILQKIGPHKQAHLFFSTKKKIRSSESDRIIKGLVINTWYKIRKRKRKRVQVYVHEYCKDKKKAKKKHKRELRKNITCAIDSHRSSANNRVAHLGKRKTSPWISFQPDSSSPMSSCKHQ